MADAKTEGTKIAARCRRIGWDVELGNGRQDWRYLITPKPLPPGAKPIQIHSSPSDQNWADVVWRQLNKAGFKEAEERYLAAKEERRAEAERAANERIKRAAEKAEEQAAALQQAAGRFAGPQPVDTTWLTTPTEFEETRTVIMTPEAARLLLGKHNNLNRPHRPAKVALLKQIIVDGEWALTHQGGASNVNGDVQDGQHRLMAIDETDTAVPIKWTVGMPVENFRKVDTQSTRSARDVAALRGEDDPGPLAAAANMLVVLDLFGPSAHSAAKSYKVTNDKTDIAIDTYGEQLRAAVAEAKEIRKQLKKANHPALATGIFLIRRRVADDPRVNAFFRDLKLGMRADCDANDNLNPRQDPVWWLRNMINGGGYKQWQVLALIIKAWNHRIQKGPIGQLVWKPGSESFPHNVLLPAPLSADDVDEPADELAAAAA